MSSKNTWDGLQFRIMETLEKAKGVPLTALEISQRLHETEYRHELHDNVTFKVTRAVHAMKETGKIVATDARDREGRFTYVLPQRVIFPRKETAMPVNPVLRPDMAEKIVTVEPKSEKKAPTPRGAYRMKVASFGVTNRVKALLDAAPRPLTAPEIEQVATQQNWWPDGKNIPARIANTLYNLAETKRVFRLPAKGKGQGIKFVYATRKTGKDDAPLPKKPAEVKAPLPSQAWSAPPAIAERVKQTTEPAPKAALFRPVAPTALEDSITLKVTQEKFRAINMASKRFGVSLEDFCIQAIDFALSHTE